MNKAEKLIGAGGLSQTALDKMTEYGIPDYMHEGLKEYVEVGRPVGNFLAAVINNNLKLACSYADVNNKIALPAYVMWFYNQAPMGCWGHEDAYREWTAEVEDDDDPDPDNRDYCSKYAHAAGYPE